METILPVLVYLSLGMGAGALFADARSHIEHGGSWLNYIPTAIVVLTILLFWLSDLGWI